VLLFRAMSMRVVSMSDACFVSSLVYLESLRFPP
jgi:hypothetical protein